MIKLLSVALLVTFLLTGCTSSNTDFAWPLRSANTIGHSVAYVETPAGAVLELELADSINEMRTGLSDREEIGSDGMLFVYEGAGAKAIWMKDMQFPIDILWVANGQIVHLESDVRPELGVPDRELQILEPSVRADSVIELAAGQALTLGLKIGDELELKSLR